MEIRTVTASRGLAFWAYGFAIGWGNWFNGPVPPGWYASLGPGLSVLNEGWGIGAAVDAAGVRGAPQFEAWRWTTFTIESGLPSNEITALAETDSTVWVGTSTGLAWYDGFIWNVVDSTRGPDVDGCEILNTSASSTNVTPAARAASASAFRCFMPLEPDSVNARYLPRLAGLTVASLTEKSRTCSS